MTLNRIKKLNIDERKGRRVIINQGLAVVGVLGVLVENYKSNHISFEETHYF